MRARGYFLKILDESIKLLLLIERLFAHYLLVKGPEMFFFFLFLFQHFQMFLANPFYMKSKLKKKHNNISGHVIIILSLPES